MGVILLTRPGEAMTFDRWPFEISQSREASPQDVVGDYDLILPIDGPIVPPIGGRDGLRLAFLCTGVAALHSVLAADLPGDILFYPSRLALLDLERAARRTLVAARPLGAGEVLAAEHLADEDGGVGLDVTLKSAVMGRRVLYDLAAAAPIDFGMIEEDQVTKDEEAG